MVSRVLLLGVLVGSLFMSACRASTAAPRVYSGADVYYVSWDIVTAVGLGPKAVRDAGAKTVLREPAQIEKLLSMLDLGALRPAPGTSIEGDYRVVIDLTRMNGTTESFASDGSRLVRLADGASHPVNAAFQKYFAALH